MRCSRRLWVTFCVLGLMLWAAAPATAEAGDDDDPPDDPPGKDSEQRCILDLSEPERPKVGAKCVDVPDLINPTTFFEQREIEVLVLIGSNEANLTTQWDPINETLVWGFKTNNEDGTIIETIITATLSCLSPKNAQACRVVIEDQVGDGE